MQRHVRSVRLSVRDVSITSQQQQQTGYCFVTMSCWQLPCRHVTIHCITLYFILCTFLPFLMNRRHENSSRIVRLVHNPDDHHCNLAADPAHRLHRQKNSWRNVPRYVQCIEHMEGAKTSGYIIASRCSISLQTVQNMFCVLPKMLTPIADY